MSRNGANVQHFRGFPIGKVIIGRLSKREGDGGSPGGDLIFSTQRISGGPGSDFLYTKNFRAAGIDFYLHKEFRVAGSRFSLQKEFRKIKSCKNNDIFEKFSALRAPICEEYIKIITKKQWCMLKIFLRCARPCGKNF